MLEDFEIQELVDKYCTSIIEPDILILKELQEKLSDKYCLECGYCCRNNEDIVITDDELRGMAVWLDIYVSELKRRIELKPNPHKSDSKEAQYLMKGDPCYFIQKDNVCLIYKYRPMICRIYPAGDMMVDRVLETKIRIPYHCPIIDDWIIFRIVTALLNKTMPDTLKDKISKIHSEDLSKISKEQNTGKRMLMMQQLMNKMKLMGLSQSKQLVKDNSVSD